MSENKLKEVHKGSRLTVIHCKGALKSFRELLSKTGTPKYEKIILLQINSIIDGHRLSKQNFRQESELPAHPKNHVKKHFYAFKKIPIRAYGWYSETKPGVFFISHYIHKKRDELADSDKKIVKNNWERIEVNNEDT